MSYGRTAAPSKTPMVAASLYRTADNPNQGVWEHRGKVAAVGHGHSPTARRWDFTAETSLGAWTLLAIRKALDDAGLTADQVDGMVVVPDCSTGSFWADEDPIPEDFLNMFKQTDNWHDGLDQLSAEWIQLNMPELKNLKYVAHAAACTSFAMAGAIQAVGDGLTKTCLVVKGWSNFAGRYYAGGLNAQDTVTGPGKYGVMGFAYAGPMSFITAQTFQRYLHKYGKTHDMMAPFVVNSKKNGLLFPEGYWAQHRPEELSVEDYLEARWVSKPANLFDNDIPIHTSAAYVLTTAEHARDLKQKPVYVLGHASAGIQGGATHRGVPPRSAVWTLEEEEHNAHDTGRRLLESAGIRNTDVSFENMYDGFSLFHVYHIEGLGFAGIKRGEGLDLFQTDISIHGPNPVSPSGGNIGGGRTRYWNHTDSIQQIRGTAGARQIRIPANVGVSGGPLPMASSFIAWSGTPD